MASFGDYIKFNVEVDDDVKDLVRDAISAVRGMEAATRQLAKLIQEAFSSDDDGLADAMEAAEMALFSQNGTDGGREITYAIPDQIPDERFLIDPNLSAGEKMKKLEEYRVSVPPRQKKVTREEYWAWIREQVRGAPRP